MTKLAEEIKKCKTAKELNSLRMAMLKDLSNFEENQKLFIKKKNQLKRVPRKEREDGFGKIYDPEVKQRKIQKGTK